MSASEEPQPGPVTIVRSATNKDGQSHHIVTPYKGTVEVPASAIQIAWHVLGASDDFIVYPLDQKYVAGPLAVFKEVLLGTSASRFRYTAEIHDCDDFSKDLYSQASDYGWTAIGRVVDFSGRHSYNAVYTTDSGLMLVEPQSNYVFAWDRPVGHYQLQRGYVEW